VQARRENQKLDAQLEKDRKRWQFTLKPSNMVIILRQDAGQFPAGLTLSVPQEIGRLLLHKRLATIVERGITVNAVIRGELEEAVVAFGLDTTLSSQVVAA